MAVTSPAKRVIQVQALLSYPVKVTYSLIGKTLFTAIGFICFLNSLKSALYGTDTSVKKTTLNCF